MGLKVGAQAIERPIHDAHFLQVGIGADHIFRVRAGPALGAPDERQLLAFIQAARILRMGPVHQIDKRGDGPSVLKHHGSCALQIDTGHLLAGPERIHDCLAILFGDAEAHAAARTSPVQAQHKPGIYLGAPVNPGIDAKRPVHARHARRPALPIGKVRSPHQRSVAEYPQGARFFLISPRFFFIIHCGKPDPILVQDCLALGFSGPAGGGSDPVKRFGLLSSLPDNVKTGNVCVRTLAITLVALCALWSAAWYGFVQFADKRIAGGRILSPESPVTVQCDDHAISGFPFRLEVQCRDLQVAEAAGGGTALQAVRIVASAMSPGRIIADLKAPLEFKPGPGEAPLKSDWQGGQASLSVGLRGFRAGEVGFQAFSLSHILGSVVASAWKGSVSPATNGPGSALNLEIDDLVVEFAAGAMAAPSIQAAMLISEPPPVLAGLMNRRAWQAFDRDLEIPDLIARIDFGGPALTAAGNLKIAPDGLLSGAVSISIRDLAGLQVLIETWPASVSRFAGPVIGALLTLGSVSGGDARLGLVIRNGIVAAGPLPIGRIPPLR